MIIGISGWERSYKTGMGAVLATHPEELNSSFQKYNIVQGFGNLHLYKTSYPWIYLTSGELVNTIRRANETGLRDTLFMIDEADSVYNPRDYTSKEQTRNLKGLGQHAKMGNIYIYTFQRGKPEDALLGVDKILRSNTRIDLEIDYFNTEYNYLIYTLKNYMHPQFPKEGIEGLISNLDKYFSYWDTKEPVV